MSRLSASLGFVSSIWGTCQVEGDHDENFFSKLLKIFNISLPEKSFTIFVKAGGKEELRQTRKFYKLLGFDDVVVVSDLDALFSNDAKNLMKEINMDETIPQQLRDHINWTDNGDPSLKEVLERIKTSGEPTNFDKLLKDLEEKRMFVFKGGAPEMYYSNNVGEKNGWNYLTTVNDLLQPDYLKEIVNKVMSSTS